MKLLSFDIGIKNMAYCLFDVSNSNLEILDWNVIDLTNSQQILANEPLKTCLYVIEAKGKSKTKIANNKICGKCAKYEKNGILYCEKHAKTTDFLIPTRGMSLTNLRKKKLDELVAFTKIYVPNLGTTVLKTRKDHLDYLEKHFQNNCFIPIFKTKVIGACDMDLITVGRNLKESFDVLPELSTTTHVIMENQISTIAVRMKTVQGMLAQYFIMKSVPNIEFISAANKLKDFTRFTSNPEGKTFREKYKQHKVDGISICSKFLGENPGLEKWRPSLQTSKKDDLADCFLQGIWYLKTSNIITYADNLKINSDTSL
jgi:hypothetical protein